MEFCKGKFTKYPFKLSMLFQLINTPYPHKTRIMCFLGGISTSSNSNGKNPNKSISWAKHPLFFEY